MICVRWNGGRSNKQVPSDQHKGSFLPANSTTKTAVLSVMMGRAVDAPGWKSPTYFFRYSTIQNDRFIRIIRTLWKKVVRVCERDVSRTKSNEADCTTALV